MTNTNKNDFNATIGNTVLCDGFLIPMTDFVNNVGNMENYPSHENALSWIYNYATLLKQTLKLEMFVPCDEEGNILEEPKRWEDYLQYPDSFDGNKEWGELYDYQQAKEKVLFVFKLNFYILLMKHHILQGRNIEYLANFAELELTESAVKQIVL